MRGADGIRTHESLTASQAILFVFKRFTGVPSKNFVHSKNDQPNTFVKEQT